MGERGKWMEMEIHSTLVKEVARMKIRQVCERLPG